MSLAIWFALGGDASLVVGVITVRVVTSRGSRGASRTFRDSQGTSGRFQGPRGWSGDFGGGPGVRMGLGGGGRLQIGSCGLRPQPAHPETSGRGTSRPVAPGHDRRLRPVRNASGGPRPRREALAHAQCVQQPQAVPGGSGWHATRPMALGHTGRLRAARDAWGGSGWHSMRATASGHTGRLRAARDACRSLRP